MIRRSVFALLLVAFASLLTACGPGISSMSVACSGGKGTVKWEASGDSVTLGASREIQGTGSVAPAGELTYDASQPAIFWITAASGSDKVTTGVACR